MSYSPEVVELIGDSDDDTSSWRSQHSPGPASSTSSSHSRESSASPSPSLTNHLPSWGPSPTPSSHARQSSANLSPFDKDASDAADSHESKSSLEKYWTDNADGIVAAQKTSANSECQGDLEADHVLDIGEDQVKLRQKEDLDQRAYLHTLVPDAFLILLFSAPRARFITDSIFVSI
jgi:hypothetical protein